MTNLTKIIISAVAQIVILVALSSSASAADNNFNASMRIISSVLSITEQQPLQFVDAIAGKNTTIVTRPADVNAAVFSVTGIPGAAVTAGIVEKRIVMTTGDGSTAAQKIVVKGFKKGGSLNKRGRAEIGANGTLNNMRIGARTNVNANNVAGDYAGTATFRVVYR
ncbi:MAG: DUF4402 domain-containing protein [Pseudomonadales bacterium]|nr:DUF4402 domain-containing protein [Pseudomonadales bacterium]